MPDNLTLKFKEELERRGIVATDAQIESFLKTQRQTPVQAPVNLGGNLYSNVNPNLPSWYEGAQQQEQPDEGIEWGRSLYEGIGLAAWQYADIAGFTIPSALLGTMGIDPVKKYEELLAEEGKEFTGLGKVGKVVGQAAGFLKPIKWVTKGTSAVVSRLSSKGGQKVVSNVLDDASKVATEKGLSSNVFRSTLDSEFKKEASAKLLANYSLSPVAIEASKRQLKQNIGQSLQTAFPKAEAGLIDDMAERIILDLGKNGRHINSVGQWIQRSLGRTLSLNEQGMVSKWATHAGEMTVSFGLFNTMVNGVQAMAGNEDFDPVAQMKHALLFSAFLPFVEAIPGGGKIPIKKTAQDIRKILNTYKNTNYDDMSASALNGLLKIITNNNHLKEKSYGVIAANNAWRDLSKKEAIKVLDEIKATGGLDKIWSEFASAAGKDLAMSTARMVAGALYFNAETLMDEQYIKGIDPTELGAHLVVGAFFTRMRKPTFDKQAPTLENFQAKLELLRSMGIDASSAEAWNSYYNNRQIMAAANGGVISEPRLKSIYDIIYNEANQEMSKSEKVDRIGSEILDPEFNLLRFAKDMADIRRVSEAVHNSEPENLVALENLSRGRARELLEKLKEVKINEEGEFLNENNFDDFHVNLQRTMVENGANTIVKAVSESARRLGLQVEGSAEEFNLDRQTLRIENIEGDFNRLGENHGAIVEYQTLVNLLKAHGYLGNIRAVEGKNVDSLLKSENIDALNSEVEGLMRSMTERLKKDNFPEGVEIDVLPTDNAWLTLLSRYRTQKDLVDLYNGIKGKNTEMYESLRTILGTEMPNESAIRELVTVSREKPENIEQAEWERIQATSLPELQSKLQLVASLWGKENRAATNRKVEVSYEDAQALVGMLETNNRSIFREGFLDRFSVYHTSREFKDARLGVREAGIMNIAKEFLVGDKRIEDSNLWVFPDGEAVKEYLKNEGYSESEIPEMMEKYDKIKTSLSRMDGKYIKFEDQINLNAETKGDVGGFINAAFELTGVRQRDLIKEYDKVREKAQEQVDMIEQTNSIIESLFDTEANTMRKLPKSEVEKVVAEINKLLPEGQSEITKFKDKDLQQYMKTLKETMEKWMEASDAAAEFSMTDSMYEGGLGLISSRSQTMNKLRDTIQRLQDLGSSSIYRARNSSRVKSELAASLVRKLKEMKIEISEEATLDEIYDKYDFEPGKKNIENFLEEVNIKIISEQRNLSSEQYDALNQELSRNRNILSDNNSEVPKLTYQTIERTYGEYNSELKDENLADIRRRIDESIELGHSSSIIALNVEFLTGNVHRAIEKKNDGDFIKSMAEKIQFNKELGGLLSPHFGTSPIKTISFSENGLIKGTNKAELLIENKFEADGGLSQFQKNWIGDGDAPIFVYKVGRNSVYGGRSYEDFADIPAGAETKGSLFDKPARVVDRAEGGAFADFSGSRATVSYVDQLYIRTDNIINRPEVAQRFKRKFDEWYDTLQGELRGSDLTNFERMFKEWRDVETLGLDANVVRDIMKSMYWHHLSPEGFKDLVASANNREVLNERAVSLLKYFNTMSTGGAKVRGSGRFLRTMQEIAKSEQSKNEFWWDSYETTWNDVSTAIDNYSNRGHLRVKSIKDESIAGFGAKAIVRSSLISRRNEFAEGTNTRKEYDEMISKLDNGDFASLESSAINAQSWMGTDAAHLMYLHKGRLLTDNIAGVKPVGWSQTQDMLLKTNFVYDKNIADLLDKAGIDILTTESAAKRFGPGHTELVIQGKDPQGNIVSRKIKEGDYKDYAEAFIGSYQSLKDAPLGQLRMSDLYLGKTNERKMANVSYGVLDFVDKIGYHAFTKDYIDYYGRLDAALGDILKMRDPKDITRNEAFANTVKIARENGEVFNDATSGSLNRLIEAGVDVQSALTMAPAERMVVKRILGEMGKVKSEHGSYSVLVPYLEGSVPRYGKVEGKDTQLEFGGKKLSSFDGDIKIGDYDKVKFIFEYKDPSGEGWDFQVGTKTKAGKIEVFANDPYFEGKIGKTRSSFVESFIKEVRQRLDRQFGQGNATYKNLYDVLESMGEKTSINGEKMKGKIHSLSLRIPNLAGDIAIHKVEGFLDRSLGNSTGINPYDLAVVHQADFDVDAVFNHHDMPRELINSVTRNVAKTPDAFPYESDAMGALDIFNMGKEINTVGKGQKGDSLEEYYNNFRNSQRIFGSIMNLAPGLSALKRLEFSFENGKMMDLESNTFIPVKQRMKNSLQTIIDATKKSNVLSRASAEDVSKFILFGRKFDGSEKITERLAEYRETKEFQEGDMQWDGIFDLSKYKGSTKEVMEDAILESINTVNTQNRMLTGVNDAAGRRAPDFNQMMYLRNRLERFLSNPNKTVFNNLLFKYRVLDKQRKQDLVPELINLFYGTKQESYSDAKSFLNDLFKKGKKDQVVDIRRNNIISLRREPAQPQNGEKNIHLTGVGGIIADKFGTQLNDGSSRVKAASATDTKFVHDFIDKFETANMLLSEEPLIGINEFTNTVNNVGGKELFGKYGDMFFSEMAQSSPNTSIVQKYSVMYHVLQQRESSLRRFISSNMGSKYKSNSVARAQYKLNVIGSAKDYFNRREAELIDSVRPEDAPKALKNHFHFVDYDLRKRPSGYKHINRTSEIQYIYRVNEKNARVKYSFVGTVAPLGSPINKRFLRKGSEYVVLKNPVRYELMTNKEVQDGFALLKTTGEAIADNIEGMNPNMVDAFYDRLSKLKRDFYELNNETFKLVRDSQVFAQRNWMDAKLHEDKLIRDFFEQTLDGTSQSHDALFTAASIVMKPTATSGLVRLKAGKDFIALPTFKINRRLVLAVERYIHSRANEPGMRDVYDSIFGEYGRHYRRAVNKIAHPTEESMYRSDLYANGNVRVDRNPLLDFVYDKPGFLYMPNVLQRVQTPLRRYGGRSYKVMDMHGNVRRVVNYEGIGKGVETLQEYYSSEKNYEDTINSREACR